MTNLAAWFATGAGVALTVLAVLNHKAIRTVWQQFRSTAAFAQDLRTSVGQVDVVEGLVGDFSKLVAHQEQHAAFVEEQFEVARTDRGAIRAGVETAGGLLDGLDSRVSRIEGKVDTILALIDPRQERRTHDEGHDPERRRG